MLTCIGRRGHAGPKSNFTVQNVFMKQSRICNETIQEHQSHSIAVLSERFRINSCGQTVGWIKMPLGKVVGLGPGYIVLDGDPVGTQPPTAAPPHFWHMPIVAKRSPISATAELLL